MKYFTSLLFCLILSCATHQSLPTKSANRAPSSITKNCINVISNFFNRIKNKINYQPDETGIVPLSKKSSSLTSTPKNIEGDIDLNLYYSLLENFQQASGGSSDYTEVPDSLLNKVKKLLKDDTSFYEDRFIIVKKDEDSYSFLFKTPVQYSGGKGIKTSYKKSSKIWSMTTPAQFPSGRHITLSNDSELPYVDSYRILLSDIDAALKLEEFTSPYQFTLEEIAKRTKQSIKQVDKFVLRKNVDRNKTYFVATDINPTYAEPFLRQKANILEEEFSELFFPSVEKIFRENNFPFRAHDDNGYIELTHETWEDIPSNFFDLMSRLNRVTQYSMDHLHGGFPAEDVSEEQFETIAKIIETKAVLAKALAFGANVKEMEYSSSNFFPPEISEWRGMVRAVKNEWSKPFPSHNLEIRQYNNITHGMYLLEEAVSLGLNSHNLKIFTDIKYPNFLDKKTQSLAASLKFAALYLERFDQYQELALETHILSQEITKQAKAALLEDRSNPPISDELRTEVQIFLKETKLLDILEDLTLFYKETNT